MKIKDKIKSFMADHPNLTAGLTIGGYACVTAAFAVISMAAGVHIANNAMLEATAMEPELTVADFLKKYGPLKSNK